MRTLRSIFLSDVHLGTPACHAERLAEFLDAHEAQRIYLVGDIVDLWAMRRRGLRWSAAQTLVLARLLERARRGVEIVFVPGNHDEALRTHAGQRIGSLRIERDCVHTGADGRRWLVLHGDEFDGVTRCHRLVAALGSRAYDALVWASRSVGALRRRLRRPGHWSLAAYAKGRLGSAAAFIREFEEAVVRYARERGVDGVICGHIHTAAAREAEGVAYLNCGDWVESCTAVVEQASGRMELVHWEAERIGAGAARAGAGAAPRPTISGVEAVASRRYAARG